MIVESTQIEGVGGQAEADLAVPQSSGKVVALKAVGRRTTPGIRFLDLCFDTLRLEEAARLVVNRARSRLPFVYVATPNVDHRVRLEREPRLKSLYDSAWMTLCDSRVIELMARFSRVKVRAAPGADIVEHLFNAEIKLGDVLNVVGSSRDVIEILKARYGLADFRWHPCPPDLRNDPVAIQKAAQFVADNPAHITFICVGSPQQELVAQAIAERGDAGGVGLCCGASLEFLSGKVPRAPKWMRNIALEWLHRLATDPVRFSRRYLVDGPAIFPIWLRSNGEREQPGAALGAPVIAREVGTITIHPAA